MAIRYAQRSSDFIAGQVFPIVPVMYRSDFYSIFKKADFMRDDVEVRPMGGRPAQTFYDIEKGHYFCEEYALEARLDDRERANAEEPIQPELRIIEALTEKQLIHRDRLWVEAYMQPGVWNTQWEGVTGPGSEPEHSFKKFDLSGGEEPINFFDERCREMKEQTGQRPNVLVIGPELFVKLKNNVALIERIKYTYGPGQQSPGVVTPSIMAKMFDVERVLVAEAVYNSAGEGQTEKIEFICPPKDALLCYAAAAPSINRPSAGYTFAWTTRLPGVSNAFGGVIYRGREEAAHSDWFQTLANYDMRPTALDLGMFIKEAV